MGSCGQQGVDIQPSWRMVEGEREREREREEGYSLNLRMCSRVKASAQFGFVDLRG